ncbi:MAG: acetoacetate decarboxylase family protein [Thermoanaerobaculia bacterium]|nr:acetoacetate decarboxylase family protein [Thermoanaerobaculia bacterium]
MIAGTADPGAIAGGCPRLEAFGTEPVVLEAVETLQVVCEVASAAVEARLPPALHPTIPGILSWLVQRVPDSPWGPFALAQTRIECRSGVRPRAFLTAAVVDNDQALAALATGWGYRLRRGVVRLRRHYDVIEARVGKDGDPELELALRDPEPLEADYVQYVANMNLAETPAGLRLIQIDPDYASVRSERGTPEVRAFDAEAWSVAGLEPAYPVSASLTVGTVTLPALRFVCRPDVWAFEGTERV